LWIGPARSHAGQLDISQFPEMLRAAARSLRLVDRHRWWPVGAASGGAARALRDGILGQR
jgi:hypothetical protein